MANKRATYTQLALGMAIFGSATPVSKIVTQQWPVFVGSFGRMLLAGLILAPFVLIDWKALRQSSKRQLKALALITIFGMVGFSVFMLYGMSMTTGTAASIIMATTPAVTAIGAWTFFKEKMNRNKIIAIILAFSGALVVNISQFGQGGSSTITTIFGSLLIFAAVCCQAVYTLAGKTAGEQLRPVTIAGATSIAAALLFLPLAFTQFGQLQFDAINLTGSVALAWWGVGTLALGTRLLYSGMQNATGSIASAFTAIMPASALVLSYLLLDEAFEWIHLVGFSLVVASIFVMVKASQVESTS